MTALQAAKEKLERAIARLEAAETASNSRQDSAGGATGSVAVGGDVEGLVAALEAAQSENADLVTFNEDIAQRLDGAIARLQSILAADKADQS